MKSGSADVNIDFDPSGKGSGGDQGLKGYLARDQNLEYTFVPSAQVPFSYGAPSPAPCSDASTCSAGYRVKIQNGRTLDVISDKTYTTNSPRRGESDLEARSMLNDLNKTSGSDRLVTITTFSSRPTGQSRFLAPIAPLPTSSGGIAKATMNALADAVARLGGTHNAFNLTALAQGAQPPAGSPMPWSAGPARGRVTASSPPPACTAPRPTAPPRSAERCGRTVSRAIGRSRPATRPRSPTSCLSSSGQSPARPFRSRHRRGA